MINLNFFFKNIKFSEKGINQFKFINKKTINFNKIFKKDLLISFLGKRFLSDMFLKTLFYNMFGLGI